MSSSGTEPAGALLEALLAADGEWLWPGALNDDQAMALAESLRAVYFASYGADSARAAAAARGLGALARRSRQPAIAALAAWVSGLAALQLDGQIHEALARLDEAEARLAALGRHHDAAATRVGQVVALAILGRYDEAMMRGREAREALLSHGDGETVGRIELNLGNLCYRRDQYAEAEQYYRDARARFGAAGDEAMLAAVENGLANVLSQQLQIPAAAALYEQALVRAEALGLEATQADIECNLGGLALFRGRYDEALSYLERSRRRYAALSRPHESAISELELAEAYGEMNLTAEAAAIYARVADTFAALDMQADQARALLSYGRASIQLGHAEQAWALLDQARVLYTDQGNAVGAALVTLAEAQLAHMTGDHALVAEAASSAAPALSAANAWHDAILARWLAAEAARALGRLDWAGPALAATLAAAEASAMPRIAQRCLTSLARLARARDDFATAEQTLRRAIAIGEDLRAPLPADEIRAAFAQETLAPYSELAALCMDDPAGPRVEEALICVELGRGRALLEMLGDAPRLPDTALSGGPAGDLERIQALRSELNWLYSRLARPLDEGESQAARALQQQAALQRERELAELRRLLSPGTAFAAPEPLDLSALRADLGRDTALVAYVALDGKLTAFVVTDEGVAAVRALAAPRAAEEQLRRLRFQIGALGHGAAAIRGHLATLTERTRRHLATLYDLLLRPLEALIGDRRLVVVPHGALHYVPFHALFDGEAYTIERREVCVTPSAAVLRHCLSRPRSPVRSALVVGVADAHAPRVRDEALGLAPLFASSALLLDGEATTDAIRAAAPASDLVHLACHGRFRADNPLFSALRLGDGWLTVHEAYSLDLRCQLVTLSACETGVSAVAPGDELLGLARGFFTAGAPSLCVSLWAVDDEATAETMAALYRGLRTGAGPAAALRAAQLRLLRERPHPFFWAPFMLLGRW